jgi:hypothetical protein
MNYPPHLAEIFEKLRNGYHISPEDDAVYPALHGKPEDYMEYFSGLGLCLQKHKYDFYFFEPEDEDRNSPRLAKIAVFAFILIDYIANRGLPVEPTIFGDTFTLRALPHLGLDSYRARLEQVGIIDHSGLRDVVNALKNVGWAKWLGDDEFQFLRPFHRMLDKCLELAKQAGESVAEAPAGSQESQGQPQSGR